MTTSLRQMCSVLVAIILVACERRESQIVPKGPQINYSEIVDDLGLEAIVYACKDDSGGLVVRRTAGSAATINSYRRILTECNMSMFTDDERIEGVVIVGGSLGIPPDDRRETTVRTLSVIDGRCTLKEYHGVESLAVEDLVQAVADAEVR